MEHAHPLPGPSRLRKRATKACLACRARKVRCDVSQRGRPCMNCYLDGESCVVIGRAARSRKPKEDEGDTNAAAVAVTAAAAAGGNSNHAQRRDSEEPGAAPAHGADADALMDTASDGGGGRLEARSIPVPGLSAVNTTDAATGHETQVPGSSSRVAPAHCAPQHGHHQQQRSSTRARLQQLHWAGEQSMSFGSDITYTYYPFLTVDNLSSILPQDVSYLEMQGCLRVPVQTILDDFVKQYFLHVHPVTPLLNEGDVWDMYGSRSTGTPVSENMSLLVLQAMLFSACNYVPRATIRALGFPGQKAARAAFYRRSKLLFDFEAESSPVAIAQAALLLSSWNPNPTRRGAHGGGFWLSISIEQARLAGAHTCSSTDPSPLSGPRNPEVAKRRNSLKRLWWCIILHDRLMSLCSQRPVQVTRAHFNPTNITVLEPADLADEIERSRVYNSGTKKSLIEVVAQMMKLAMVLTDLLTVVWPLDGVAYWNERFGDEEKERLEDCKTKMSTWYSGAVERLRTLGLGGLRLGSEFSHDSVVLYYDFMRLLYNCAMTGLCHHECIRLVKRPRRSDPRGTFILDKQTLAKNQHELHHAFTEVTECLEGLVRRGLSRRLPLSSIACVSLPLVLNIIDAKLTPTLASQVSVDNLRELDESVKTYQPQHDTTDWMSEAVREMLDLAQLDDIGRTTFLSTGEEDGGNSLECLHPSVYLRLALSLDPSLRNTRNLGSKEVSASVLRLFAPSTANRVKPILTQRERTRRKSPAGSPGLDRLASKTHERSMQQMVAEWVGDDQAVSYGVQLGIVPPDLAREEGKGASPGSNRIEDESATSHRTFEDAEWENIMDQAFSETGDVLESNLLDVFVIRDQAQGTHDPGQLGFTQTGDAREEL